MVGFDSGNALFDTAEETGGSADAITVKPHSHCNINCYRPKSLAYINAWFNWWWLTAINKLVVLLISGATIQLLQVTGITVATSIASTGSSGTNANYQPYITVYMWKRTA
jgi:hypothetical protein